MLENWLGKLDFGQVVVPSDRSRPDECHMGPRLVTWWSRAQPQRVSGAEDGVGM